MIVLLPDSPFTKPLREMLHLHGERERKRKGHRGRSVNVQAGQSDPVRTGGGRLQLIRRLEAGMSRELSFP